MLMKLRINEDQMTPPCHKWHQISVGIVIYVFMIHNLQAVFCNNLVLEKNTDEIAESKDKRKIADTSLP